MQPQSITLPKKAIDLTGQKFNSLTAIAPVAIRDKAVVWLCQCDCGNQSTVKGSVLRNGRVLSCGCSLKEKGKRQTTHGMSQSPIYAIWTSMRERCTNPANRYFADYGGRGVICYPEWRDSFEAFHAHVSQLPNFGTKGYSLDRVDNSRGYEPSNVRWATSKEQGRNRRDNHYLTHDGISLTIVEWAERLRIDKRTLQARITVMKWDVERALTTPVRQRRK